MATGQQKLVTLDSFKHDFTTSKLLSRLSDRILDQHEARVAAAATNTRASVKQSQALPYESMVSLDQLLVNFERADNELKTLRRELDDKVNTLSKEVGAAEIDFQEQAREFEENFAAMTSGFNELDRRMSNVTSIATKFGDRLQSTDSYRRNAEEAIRVIQALQEFSSIENLDELPDFYHKNDSLTEAAALTRKILELANEVTTAKERVSTQPQLSAKGGATQKVEFAERGTIEYAKQQLENYRNCLDNKVASRFDKAEAKGDLAVMAACARIMQEFENSASGTSLVQRYISTRNMFIDPRDLALGQTEAVVDTNTALAAKRRLGTLYKSITQAVRHEAAIMKAVFAKPQEALTIFVHRLFEQRIQNALTQMLTPPGSDASKEMLEAYLKLLAEAYQSTCTLARNLQDLMGKGTDVMDLVEAAFSDVLESYPDTELALLRLQYHNMPPMGPRGVLLQDPVVQYFKWNQDALERAAVLCPDSNQRAEVVRRTVHNSKPKEEDVGCLLEQVAIHLMTGLEGALQQCMLRLGQPYESASLHSMHRTNVRQAALRVVEQGIGQVLGAVSQAGTIVKLLQAHYTRVVAPLLEGVPTVAHACSKGFAAMLRAVEDKVMSTMEAAIVDLFSRAEQTLATEQRRLDFRPSDDLPAPLDQPTEAAVLVSALLAAVLQEASQTLQAANLVSFSAEIGVRAHKMLLTHMQHFSFSTTGALRWKRDVTEYIDAARPALKIAPIVRAKFEELTGVVSILLVAPDSLPALVDSSLRLPHSQALQFVKLREDWKTARVQGKSLQALFAADKGSRLQE